MAFCPLAVCPLTPVSNYRQNVVFHQYDIYIDIFRLLLCFLPVLILYAWNPALSDLFLPLPLYRLLFCSDLLVPYESGLDSIESTKTIYRHCIRLSFLRPHITKRSEGKIQRANAKNFIFLFLSLTYTKEERCFYRVLEKFFYFCAKK